MLRTFRTTAAAQFDPGLWRTRALRPVARKAGDGFYQKHRDCCYGYSLLFCWINRSSVLIKRGSEMAGGNGRFRKRRTAGRRWRVDHSLFYGNGIFGAALDWDAFQFCLRPLTAWRSFGFNSELAVLTLALRFILVMNAEIIRAGSCAKPYGQDEAARPRDYLNWLRARQSLFSTASDYPPPTGQYLQHRQKLLLLPPRLLSDMVSLRYWRHRAEPSTRVQSSLSRR